MSCLENDILRKTQKTQPHTLCSTKGKPTLHYTLPIAGSRILESQRKPRSVGENYNAGRETYLQHR